MSKKRIAVIVILFVCSLSFLFAEEEVNPNLNYSSKFFLAHSVNKPNVSFHSEVWDTSNKKITTVTLASAGFHQLGSFVLVFNSTVVFTSIKIKFEALTSAETNAQGAYDCYPYSIIDDLRLDISTRTVRAGIVMRDKTDGGYFFLDVRLQRGVDIALLVELHIAEAFRLKFFFQVLCKQQLFGCTRHAVGIFSRLRVKFRIV